MPAYTGSKAQSGRGSSIAIGPIAGTASPTFVNIGEVKESGITGASWATESTTNFDSGSDEEFITTIRNNGEASLSGNRVSSDAGQAAVEAAFQSGGLYMFKLQLPKVGAQTVAGDSYTFNAIVMSSDFTPAIGKVTEFTIKLKISGPRPLTLGS